MRIIAPMMILIMMTSTLAGCTGGDPDGGGNDEIDMDILNQLIDDNLQDFINNTTITVENHYHNNTTVMNDNTDYSVSNINGSSSASTLKMFTVEWDREQIIMDNETIQPGLKMVTLTGGGDEQNGTVGDNTLLFTYGYNGYVIELRMNCNEYIHYQNFWDDEEWYDWLIDNYGSAGDWRDTDDLARDIEQDIYNNWYNGFDAYQQCYFSGHSIQDIVLYEIELVQGEAISILVNGLYITTDVNCADGYGTGIGNGTSTGYIGGQSDCVVSGSTNLNYQASGSYSGNIDPYTNRDIVEYNWYISGTTPSSFAVYFNSHIVEVYDLEEN
jgi:hypothetical protein